MKVILNKIWFIVFLIIIFVSANSCKEHSIQSSKLGTKEKVSYEQDFSGFVFYDIPNWREDNGEYDGPYSEYGEYYLSKGILPPKGYRNTIDIGNSGWLTAELYTRTQNPILLDYLDVVQDPVNPMNKVLKIKTPEHTDGVILRSSKPLPSKYRISLKIGHVNYGDETVLNGYSNGNETAKPWRNLSSVGHNGFYWLSILDSMPKPHNNVWIHHHRKFVIDSWNRKDFPYTVNVIALDGQSDTHQVFGKKFISYLDNRWQKISDVPVDQYLPNEWYELTFTRTPLFYEFSITGKFRNAGQHTYSDRINIRTNCVYHYNQTQEELSDKCIDERSVNIGGKNVVNWPKNSAYPEYFMFGEPHINYYEGSVLIDDILLEEL